MKKIIQLGNFLCDDGTNLPIRGRLFSAHGCSPTIYNFGSGGAGIKDCAMEVKILVNGTPEKKLDGMQGYPSLIRQMWVHVAMASHWARHLWRVDIQRRGAMRKEIIWK